MGEFFPVFLQRVILQFLLLIINIPSLFWVYCGIMKYREGIYAAICHLQTGSIRVSVGDTVTKGDLIGKIGHSGNSFAPHLHFQLMDSSDIVTANGVPCAFEKYEVFQNGTWKRVANGIPTRKDRIRFLQSETKAEQEVL